MATQATCTLADGQELLCSVSGLDVPSTGAVFFLFAIFCAYWAQTSGRSAWLWFFLGLFFAPVTGLFLLYKNSNDRTRQP